jgi:hypothetical protein
MACDDFRAATGEDGEAGEVVTAESLSARGRCNRGAVLG